MNSWVLSRFLRGPLGLKLRERRLSLGDFRQVHSVLVLPLQVIEELQAASVHSDERELLQLLSTPHLKVVTPQSLPVPAACISWDGGRRERSARRLRKEGEF